jgi:hypothetical protein
MRSLPDDGSLYRLRGLPGLLCRPLRHERTRPSLALKKKNGEERIKLAIGGIYVTKSNYWYTPAEQSAPNPAEAKKILASDESVKWPPKPTDPIKQRSKNVTKIFLRFRALPNGRLNA